MEKATFAAGCFWGVEADFRKIKGVIATQVGYTGGNSINPTYEDVCTGTTGHAEAVEIIFDPNVVSYDELLDIFWKIHNPTTLNQQGLDIGTQYRSAIFYQHERQKNEAEKSKELAQRKIKYDLKFVTEITPASTFYRAEEYHQQYFEKGGKSGCMMQ